ncbi:MAG TPA: heavy metal-associated domain-containing protein [Burkholderiaceae bacterium]|jgi:mercuric ion binding protein|nr:heavy metal-associated domain-containing protein [Burkholderiaceae bacterium]
MKRIITILIFLFAITASAAQAVQTVKANVDGMVCAFCAQGIDRKLRALPQTKDVYVNLKRKIVAVEVKEGQALPGDTVRDVVKNAGYDITNIQTLDQSIQQVKVDIEKEQ